jgi:prenyltransferase beta subunit
MDRYEITQDRILEEYASIAFARITDVVDWDNNSVTIKDSQGLTDRQVAAIQEVSRTESAQGGVTKVKFADKLSALNTLAKIQGMLVDRKLITLTSSLKEMTDEELRNFVEELDEVA